jgi:hypothetical protein
VLDVAPIPAINKTWYKAVRVCQSLLIAYQNIIERKAKVQEN